MGRKIPARKHHGTRDPILQNKLRLEAIKDKIDNPPTRKDFQKVSQSFARFMKLKEIGKSGKVIKKPVDTIPDVPENYQQSKKFKNDNIRPQKELPAIKRLPNETDFKYLKRVNQITRDSFKEAEFENKYGVDVIRNNNTGKITLRKRPKDEFAEQIKKNKDNKRVNDKNKKPNDISILMTNDEKKKLAKEIVLKRRKASKEAKDEIKDFKYDDIKFGEIVHAPPTLPKPRLVKKNEETVSRPGKKELLLNSILSGETASDTRDKVLPSVNVKKSVQKIPDKFDLKGKRKDLPSATRRMIDTEQKKFVDLYKQMKKQKRNVNKSDS